MRNFLTAIFFLVLINNVSAQVPDLVKIADSISTEGNMLYRSEWASWYGSDIFSAKCPGRRLLSGGYISYDTGSGLKNVFFSKGDNPVILSTISFGYDFNSNNYTLDTTDRKFTPQEKSLYTIRQAAIAELNKDTLFKRYNHTSLNPVPFIVKKARKVYVLTGPDISGVVVFGNDYLITFDQNNNIITKTKLHKGIIPVNYGKAPADSNKTVVASIHSHLPEYSPFITATDICTLRLYEKFTTWKHHIVMSKNYVSSWDCERDKLVILTTEAWKKIYSAKDELDSNSH